MTVEALAARFGTSQVTIRADLASLESARRARRAPTAARCSVPNGDQPLDVKQLQHHAEKVRIAAAAAA